MTQIGRQLENKKFDDFFNKKIVPSDSIDRSRIGGP